MLVNALELAGLALIVVALLVLFGVGTGLAAAGVACLLVARGLAR